MTRIISKNTTIPCRKSETFTTNRDYQSICKIKVYEGEREFTKDNHLLGEFNLTDIPQMCRGQPQIKIDYNIDSNGILNVTAYEKSIGVLNQITVINNKGRLSKEEINIMIDEANKQKINDMKMKEIVESKNLLEKVINQIKNILDCDNINLNKRNEIEKKCDDIINWLNENKYVDNTEYKNKYKELELIFKSLNSNSIDNIIQNNIILDNKI